MGADFCYAVVPRFEWNDRREESVRAVLKKVTDTRLFDLADNYGISYDFESDTLADDLREHFVRSVQESLDLEGRRDVGCLGLEDMPYTCLITGGMSYGDAPTDAYDIFWPCGVIPELWHLLIDFAREDYAKIGQTNTSNA